MAIASDKVMRIFIGHTKEDANIAAAIAETLMSAFNDDIAITMMAKFSAGTNWRKLIADSVRSTDVMICVATGRLKASHSFTGMEVGVFIESLEARPQMKHFALDRKMIPFAILARVPETIEDYQGIDLDAKDIVDVRFDEETLQNEVNTLSSPELDASRDKVLKFLSDLETMRIRAFNRDASDVEKSSERRAILTQHSRTLSRKIFQIMLGKEKESFTPKTRITIRTPLSGKIVPNASIVEQSDFRIFGNGMNIFGLSDTEGMTINWNTLTGRTKDAIRFEWNKVLNKLLTSSTQSDYLNDNCITAYDESRKFRIFVSKVTEYYGKNKEYELYVVEILKRQDLRDTRTTKLLKALEISLRYRDMFLGERSDFSPLVFQTEKLEQIQDRAYRMLDELNSALVTSQEYGLQDSEFLIDLLGRQVADTIDEKREKWEKDKNGLIEAADGLMSLKRVTPEDKRKFVKVVEDFCANNTDNTQEWIAAVASALQTSINGQRPKPEGKGPQLTPRRATRSRAPKLPRRRSPSALRARAGQVESGKLVVPAKAGTQRLDDVAIPLDS